MERVVTFVPTPTHDKLKSDCETRGIAVSEMVRRILDSHYENRPLLGTGDKKEPLNG